MNERTVEQDTLPVDETIAGERPVATTVCPRCNYLIHVDVFREGKWDGIQLEGILTCTKNNCGARWPIKVVDNQVRYVDEDMPSRGAGRLSREVPEDYVQDMEEADKAFYGQAYKGVVVLCRRVVQLGLEDHGAEGRTLGPVLGSARKLSPPPLTARAFALAEGIKDFGDGGAHRREKINREDALGAIHAAVTVLNELFPEPPAPKEPRW